MKKILLDENLPKKLKYEFGSEYKVLTVSDMKWNSLTNGELLQSLQENEFEILVTVDKNLSYQQNLDKFDVTVILLNSKDNRYETLLPYVAKMKEKLQGQTSKKFIKIDL